MPKERTRVWALVIYPDSAPSNWLEQIDELHTEALLSPLHDKDVNPDGEPKKAHYHLLLMFNGVKSYEQVDEIAKALGTQHPVKVQSAKGYARYLIHLDNPEKHQYDRKDIKAFAGVDVAEYLKPSASARYELIAEMMEHVRLYSITEFAELMEYAAKHRRDDWFPVLCDNSAYVMSKYIQSKRFQVMSVAMTPRRTIEDIAEEEKRCNEEVDRWFEEAARNIEEQNRAAVLDITNSPDPDEPING